MNTLTKGIAKRAISILLVAIMVLSLGIIGISTASAAEFEIADVGYDGSHTMWCISDRSWDNNSISLMTRDETNKKWWKTFDNVPTSQSFYFALSVSNNDYLYPADTSKKTVSPYHNDVWNIWYNDSNSTSIGTYNAKQGTSWEISMSSLQSYSTVSVTIEFFQENSHIRVYIGNGAKPTTISSVTLSATPSSDIKVNSTVALKATATITNPSGTRTFVYTVTEPDNTTTNITKTSSSNTYTLSYTPEKVGTYTVKVTVKNNGQEKISTAVTFEVKPDFELTVNAEIINQGTLYVGQDIEIFAQTNDQSGADITYTLYDNDENEIGEFDEFGLYTLKTTDLAAGDHTYKVVATGTISGQPYTAETEVTFTLVEFTGLTVKIDKFSNTVECNTPITVKASANTSEKVTYVITDKDTGKTYENEDGNFSIATTVDDKNTTKKFVLTATAEVNGKTYKSNEINFSVEVTDIKEFTDITIYFKSSSTYGYVPTVQKVQGVLETREMVPMEKVMFIRQNETKTADYWWYSVTTRVAKSSPTISITIILNRYDFESTYTLTVVDGVNEYYLAADNLNKAEQKIVDLTFEEDLDIRDFCESAVHMVYDPEFDAEETLVAVASTYARVQNGDVNGDGKVNVRDATLLQKSLANIEELSDVGTKVADANNDGTITIKDATAIQKAVAGL